MNTIELSIRNGVWYAWFSDLNETIETPFLTAAVPMWKVKAIIQARNPGFEVVIKAPV